MASCAGAHRPGSQGAPHRAPLPASVGAPVSNAPRGPALPTAAPLPPVEAERCFETPLSIDTSRLTPLPLTADDQRLLDLIGPFIQRADPRPGVTLTLPGGVFDHEPVEIDLATARLIRARTLLERRRWDESGPAYRVIAIEHPDSDQAALAALLYFESLRVIGGEMEARRWDCLQAVAADAGYFFRTLCEERAGAEAHCRELRRMADQAAQLGEVAPPR